MKKVKKITRRLKAHRKALLEAYDDEELHQLRVNIRRIRGLLKQHPGQEAREIRKSLGKLAKRTNAARDWDTFALYVRHVLNETDWHPLSPLLQRQLDVARKEALHMLTSEEWSEAFGHWKRYLKHEGAASFSRPAAAGSLEPVRERAALAKEQALASGQDSDWHAFRIAIKDLRYNLDALDTGDDDLRKHAKSAIALCKKLQDALGCWHDTVVHRKLLDSLAAASGSGAEEARAIDALKLTIRTRGKNCLDSAREILAGEPDILQAAGGETWSWDRK